VREHGVQAARGAAVAAFVIDAKHPQGPLRHTD
jgi:hypothetical protein